MAGGGKQKLAAVPGQRPYSVTAKFLRGALAHAVRNRGLALSCLMLVMGAACASPQDDALIERAEAVVSPVPAPRTGEDIFTSICATCHGSEGQGQPEWHVPNEDGTLPAPPLNGDGHTWHHSDGFLYRIVRNGGKFQEDPVLLPGFRSSMPAFGSQLNHEETIAVITYFKSLWGDKTSRGLLIRDAQANASANDPFPQY